MFALDWSDQSPTWLYITCVYYVIATFTSTGYGDIHATNTAEMLAAIGIMITGKLLLGYILANISSTLAHEESQKLDYELKLEGIKVRHNRTHKILVELVQISS